MTAEHPHSPTDPTAARTVDPAEVARFAAMAADWWNPNGKFRPLHKFNPTRLTFIRDQIAAHFDRDPTGRLPLDGLNLLDIGCGGGLVSEPMARLGARVTGADPAEANIAAAQIHADQQGLAIDYRATTAEALAADGARFEVILNLEVVEHVADLDIFMQTCARLLAPDGLMVCATLNRTAKALALAVVGAEYILRWLPRGTHDWNKFVTPRELTAALTRSGLHPGAATGISYRPLSDSWTLSPDFDVNYMVCAAKPR